MSNDVLNHFQVEIDELRQEQAEAVAVPLEVVPLSQVLTQVALDSRQAPQDFLNQVIVPHGGE